jgi:adsorption protein B
MLIHAEWTLAILYLISGLNDVFMDLVFYVRPLYRFFAQGRENPNAHEDELHERDQQPIAILIPAWDESGVIAAMLESTHDRLDYDNYDIFVGTYPNDEATQMEVARIAYKRPRIHRVVCPNPGPTSKADCLNWIVEAIKLRELETGKEYAIFTLQDAEDVVHPLSLKVFNRFVPEYDMIQLPVIPYERDLHKLTGGTYLDEFAEVHLKNLDSRLAIGGMVPSAGVGTAFGRDACDELAAQTSNVLFPPVSLTEDYDFSFRLFRNGRKSGIARVWIDSTDVRGRTYRDLVAIREFFPAVFRDAVRQKQRWMLGITFQGWEKLGWGTGWREKYMLVRDRLGPLTSFLNMISIYLVFRFGATIVWSLANHLAWNSDLAQYDLTRDLQLLIDANLILLAHRILQRAVCVARVARKRQMLAVPLRLVWGNVIDFYCTVHAVRRYVHSRWTGKPLKWMKTVHEYPNMETLLKRHRPIGDILLERRLISPEQLREALDKQRGPGGGLKILGEILVSMLAITPEQLEATLAAQERSKLAGDGPRTMEAQPEFGSQPMPASVQQVQAFVPPARAVEQPVLTDLAASRTETLRKRLLATAEAERLRVLAQLAEIQVAEIQVAEIQPSAIQPEIVVAAILPPAAPIVPQVPEFADPAIRTHRSQTLSTVRRRSSSRPIAIDSHAPASSAQPPRLNAAGKSASPTPISSHRRFFMLHNIAPKWKSPFPSKRFVVAVGTRPEAIKLAPLIRELQGRIGTPRGPEAVFVCATGQHGDMVEDALAQFGVRVDLNLALMTPGQTLAAVSARILARFETVLHDLKPDWVIVQGDTVTTSMAALAAFYAGIRVAHVEAGLRTDDLRHPFPEEFNRRMVGIFAGIHFAATSWSKGNLLREGVGEDSIVVTGNTGIDALMSNCERLGLNLDYERPERTGPIRVLVTAHRRENLESGIGNLCDAIRHLSEESPNKFVFLWPVHPNPKVGEQVQASLSGLRNVILRPPAQYDELLGYLQQSDVVLTDSGGLQEEAPSFGKPVLILRETTERPEGVRAGLAWLVGTQARAIEDALHALGNQIAEHRHRKLKVNPYGDGYASLRIADFFAGSPVEEFDVHRRGARQSGEMHEQQLASAR